MCSEVNERLPKETVLIVDDEEMARDVIEGFLFREGYDLAFAANAQAALVYLETKLPDVILLDVMMPNVDGFTFCRQLKSSPNFQHIPIILVTALNDKRDMLRGIDAGADDFINKPVNELELKARVRSMLRIKKQYDKLQQALKLREELSHMVVHDMKTPLTAILGYSDILLLRDNLDLQAREDLEKIYAQATRLNGFLMDMLMVAKMEQTNQLLLNYALTDLNQLVNQVKHDHQVMAELKKIDILTQLPPAGPKIKLDVNLFRRVLDNLISNALRFSPRQSTVTVSLESTNGVGDSAPHVRVRVLDTGPGIAPQDQVCIFEKFETGSAAKRNLPYQTGLGLAFCKMVVEAHGGRIFVSDNEPTGTAFTIEI
ncbi:MAG TPA: HAMP domain-containing sensor histidine kinase [Anaerolineae bacterium]|nr:HAMP domain-containing sensor histidine kinase [Anaerolineae bacterium]HMR63309.1 HAMP domain-containing sensor histidine kinase [Anaerolineae bacterium]